MNIKKNENKVSKNFFNLKINQYFLKAKKKIKSNFFSQNRYWKNNKTFKDPDGKVRNLNLEQKKKLKDLKNEILFIKSKFEKNKNVKIIDLGSGFGFFLRAFAKKWIKVGIELSDEVSEKSKEWSTIFKLNVQKKFNDDKLKKLGKFDIVFSYHVIEHLSQPEKFIENAYKLLKHNGYFILGTPNFDSGCARRFKKNYRFFKDKTHISFFSENSLFRLLDDYGFDIEKVDYPFFETNHFNKANLNRLFNKKKVSPACYGNIMTFYCKKKTKNQLKKEMNYKNKKYKELLNF